MCPCWGRNGKLAELSRKCAARSCRAEPHTDRRENSNGRVTAGGTATERAPGEQQRNVSGLASLTFPSSPQVDQVNPGGQTAPTNTTRLGDCCNDDDVDEPLLAPTSRHALQDLQDDLHSPRRCGLLKRKQSFF